MSKLKINDSIAIFLKKNKIKISAIALIGVIITSSALLNYKKTNKNTTLDKYNQMFSNIEYCLKNDNSNVEVIKDENGIYTITEYNYKEIPIYDINKNGEKIVTGYKKELSKSSKYSISTKQSEELGLTELLEAKLNNKIKRK